MRPSKKKEEKTQDRKKEVDDDDDDDDFIVDGEAENEIQRITGLIELPPGIEGYPRKGNLITT